MFASRVAKPQSKAAENPAGTQATRRSTAVTRPFGIRGREAGGFHEQEADTETTKAQEAPRAIAWEFSKIPIFPGDPPDGSEAKSCAAPSPSPMVLQPKRGEELGAASKSSRASGSTLLSAPPVIQS